MKSFESLLNETSATQENYSNLATALFENRFFGYVCHRLSYFFLRFLIHCSVFITEYFILSFVFSEDLLINALMFRLASSVITGFWWGALEELRIKVRELVYSGKKHSVANLLSDWVSFVVVVSVVYLLASVSVLGMMWAPETEKMLFALYIFTLNFRIATQLIIQTLHSSIYAISRIFRPAWSIIAIEVCSFTFTLLYWPLAGRFSLPLATLTSTIVLSAIALRYIFKAYQLFDFISFRLFFSDFMSRFTRRINFKNILLRGSSSAMMRFDAVTVGSVIYSYFKSSTGEIFFTQLMIIPFLQASFTWAQLFYFDFSKLNNPDLISYKRVFKSYAMFLSLVVGIIFWLLYCLSGSVLNNTIIQAFNFGLLPLFVLRSFFAFFQVKAFCEGLCAAIIAASLSGAISYILLVCFFSEAAYYQYFPVMAFIISILCLTLSFRFQNKEYFYPTVSSAGGFLHKIAGYGSNIEVGFVMLQKSASSVAQKLISRTITEKIGNKGYVCCVGRRQVCWFVGQEYKNLITASDIILNSAGLAEKVMINNFTDSADAAEFLKSNIFGYSLKNNLPEYSDNAVKSKFFDLFPNGRLISADYPDSASNAKNDPHYKQIVTAAFRYLRSYLPQEPGNGYQISALLSWSRIDAIFILPVNSSLSLKKEWNNYLRLVNLSRALIVRG